MEVVRCGEWALPGRGGSGRNWLSVVEAGEEVAISRYGKRVAQLAPPRGVARFLDGAPLRAGVPLMREGAGEFIAKLREDERY